MLTKQTNLLACTLYNTHTFVFTTHEAATFLWQTLALHDLCH